MRTKFTKLLLTMALCSGGLLLNAAQADTGVPSPGPSSAGGAALEWKTFKDVKLTCKELDSGNDPEYKSVTSIVIDATLEGGGVPQDAGFIGDSGPPPGGWDTDGLPDFIKPVLLQLTDTLRIDTNGVRLTGIPGPDQKGKDGKTFQEIQFVFWFADSGVQIDPIVVCLDEINEDQSNGDIYPSVIHTEYFCNPDNAGETINVGDIQIPTPDTGALSLWWNASYLTDKAKSLLDAFDELLSDETKEHYGQEVDRGKCKVPTTKGFLRLPDKKEDYEVTCDGLKDFDIYWWDECPTAGAF